jgi:hypothetical protein
LSSAFFRVKEDVVSEILENIRVRVVCEDCETEFETSADVVAESQELLGEGCPGDFHECPARWFANFVDREALQDFAEAWQRVRDSVHAPAVDLELASRPTVEGHLNAEPSQPEEGAEATDDANASFSPSPGRVTFTLGAASKPSSDGSD